MRPLLAVILSFSAMLIAAGSNAVLNGQALAQTPAASSAYTGTAEVSYTSLPRFDLPTAALQDVGQFHAIVHFAVRDRSHFRVDVQTVSPAIQAGTVTAVVDGSAVTTYDARAGIAFKAPIPVQHRAGTLNDILIAMLSGGQNPGAFGPLPDSTEPVSAYLARLQKPNPLTPVRFHASITGQDTLLGHPVDVITYGPTVVKAIANTCQTTKTGKVCRPRKFHGSGHARIWVDRDHPFILQWQGQGSANPHDAVAMADSLVYRVTSITYGQGPTNADLQLQLPMKAVHTTMAMSFMPSGSDSGPGPGVAPPGPFVYPGSPPPGRLTATEGFERLGYGPHYKIESVTALYSTGTAATAYFYKPLKLGPMPYVTGPYLFMQEQLQVAGLPAALRAGTPQTAGSCQVWTGAYPDGQIWAAFARRKAAVMITTNALTSDQVLTYVRDSMCGHKMKLSGRGAARSSVPGVMVVRR